MKSKAAQQELIRQSHGYQRPDNQRFDGQSTNSNLPASNLSTRSTTQASTQADINGSHRGPNGIFIARPLLNLHSTPLQNSRQDNDASCNTAIDREENQNYNDATDVDLSDSAREGSVLHKVNNGTTSNRKEALDESIEQHLAEGLNLMTIYDEIRDEEDFDSKHYTDEHNCAMCCKFKAWSSIETLSIFYITVKGNPPCVGHLRKRDCYLRQEFERIKYVLLSD